MRLRTRTRRREWTVGVLLLGNCVAVALASCGGASRTTASHAHGLPTLGRRFPHIVGFGVVRPPTISFGGDPTSVVSDIHWSRWGAMEAIGSGTSDWVWPGTCVGCNRPSAARVVAFRLGTCKGRAAYLAEEWFFPEYGEHFDPSRALSLCTSAATPPSLAAAEPAEPVKCPPTAMSGAGTATEVTAVSLSCTEVSRIISHIVAGPYAHENRFKIGTFRCGTEGSFGGAPSIDCELDHRSVFFTVRAD